MARAMKDKSCLLSEEVLTKYRIELLVKGSVVIAPQMLFTQDDIARIDQLQAEIPEEEGAGGRCGRLAQRLCPAREGRPARPRA